MPRTVKCGLIQCSNAAPTDLPIEDIKRLNIEKHLGFIEQAGQQGVSSNLHARGFYYALFLCRTQTPLVRGGRAHSRWANGAIDAGVGERTLHGIIVPIYEEEITGIYYNTGLLSMPTGSISEKYRKNHIPHVNPGFWENSIFDPQPGLSHF